MKTVLVILILALLLISCSAPVTQSEKHGQTVIADSAKTASSQSTAGTVILFTMLTGTAMALLLMLIVKK